MRSKIVSMISFVRGEICAKHADGRGLCSRRGCRPCQKPVEMACIGSSAVCWY